MTLREAFSDLLKTRNKIRPISMRAIWNYRFRHGVEMTEDKMRSILLDHGYICREEWTKTEEWNK